MLGLFYLKPQCVHICEKEWKWLSDFLPQARDLAARETPWLRCLLIRKNAMNFLKIDTMATMRSTVLKVTKFKVNL